MFARSLVRALTPKRLSTQLSLLAAICMLPPIIGYGWYTAHIQARAANELTRNQAELVVQSLAANLAAHLLANDFIALEKNLLTAVDSGPLHEIQVISHDGLVVTDVGRELGERAKTRFRNISIVPPNLSNSRMEFSGHDIILWSPLIPKGTLGWIRAVYSIQAINRLQQDIQRKSVLVGLGALAISVLLLLQFLSPRIKTLQRLRTFADKLDHHLGEQLQIKDESVEITALAHAFNNASTRLHQYDQDLKASEQRVRLLLESTAEAIYGIDTHCVCIFANAACAQLLGYPDAKAIIGRPIAEVISHTTREGTLIPVQDSPYYAVLQTGDRRHSDATYVLRQDNRLVPIEYWSHPILNDSNIIGAVITFFDVSEKKRAREALWESEQIFRDIAENIQNVFWMVSPDRSKIIYVSPAYEEIFDRSCQSLYDDPASWLLAIHPDDRAQMLELTAKDKVIGFDKEYRIIRTDGTIRWIRDRAFPVYDPNGQLRRITGIAVDVTSQIEIETQTRKHQASLAVQSALEQQNIELDAARLQAVHASRVKTEFLANITHEIRTPMNAIIGFTQLLGRTPINDMQRNYVNTIAQSADGLLGIINNILDFSKLDLGKMVLQHVPFTVHECMEYALQLLQRRAMSKGLDILPIIKCNAHQALIGDSARLKQVLINLIDNAIKFTEKGNVVVRISAENETDNNLLLRFNIKDTGIGISPEQQTRLFSAFVQGDASITRIVGGTGLGLAICKKLVEQMQGDIGMESHDGDGCSFWFTIPCAKQQIADIPSQVAAFVDKSNSPSSSMSLLPPNNNLLNNVRALIADDNEINRHLLTVILQQQGAEVTATTNGQQVLDAAQSTHFDVVILDIHMPVMNGIEAAKQLRQSGIPVVILGLTADALIQNRDDIAPGLFDELMIKPFNNETIVSKIAHWVNHKIDFPDNAPERTGLLLSSDEIIDHNFERFASHQDPALAQDILSMLENDLISQRALIKELLNTKDYAQLKEQLHKLQGSAAACGLPKLRAATKYFDALLRSDDLSGISTAAKNVNDAIEQVLKLLPIKMANITIERAIE